MKSLLLRLVGATVIHESPLSGPIYPLSDGLWVRLDFQSHETHLYNEDACPTFVKCLAEGARASMLDGSSLGYWRRQQDGLSRESAVGADVAGMLALGPNAPLTTASVVYLGQREGKKVMKVQQKALWINRGCDPLDGNTWSIEGPISFRDHTREMRLSDRAKVMFTFGSDDVVLPVWMKGMFGTLGRDGEVFLPCENTDASLVSGRGTRFAVDMPIHLEADPVEGKSKLCRAKVKFHASNHVEVGWSILTAHDVALTRRGINFVPRGSYDLDPIVDNVPPPIKWFRLARSDSSVWHFEPTDQTNPEALMLIKLTPMKIEMLRKNPTEEPLRLEMDVDGICKIELNEDGTVSVRFDGNRVMESSCRGRELVTISFMYRAHRFQVRKVDGGLDFLSVAGKRRLDEVMMSDSSILSPLYDGGFMRQCVIRDHGTVLPPPFLIIGRPMTISHPDGSFSVRGVSGADTWVRFAGGIVLFSPPLRRFVMARAERSLIELTEVTGAEPGTKIEFTLPIDFEFERSNEGRFLDLIDYSDSGSLPDVIIESVWEGPPVVQRYGATVRIISDSSSSERYLVTTRKLEDRIRLMFTREGVLGFLLPEQLILASEESIEFPKLLNDEMMGYCAQIVLEKRLGGFELIFSGLIGPLPDVTLSTWVGDPVLSVDHSGNAILSYINNGRRYEMKLNQISDSSFGIEFTPYRFRDRVAQIASKSYYGQQVEEERKACAICLDEFNDGEAMAMIHECGHVFHGHCLAQLAETTLHCPMCRRHMER